MRCTVLTCLMLIALLPVTAQVKTISVNPQQTGTGIVSVHGDHAVYMDPAIKSVHKLLLMIVGTDAAADHNIPFFEFTASLGYHVISLDYKNTVITTTCSNSENNACFNEFRQEIVFGTPVSSLVDVDSTNSIYHRFFALLQYLSKKYPGQGWGEYMKGNNIQWNKIIVAGHSQGAGHAAYLAKKFAVNKVLILAGPQDYLGHFNMPAGWLSEKSATPVAKYFSFLHLKDPFDFNKQLADCMKLMNATKPDTLLVQPNTDITKNRHVLVTNIATANPHESMMQPQFKKAWKYLLTTGDGK